MTEGERLSAQFHKYDDRLVAGLLSVPEVVSAVLHALANSPCGFTLWAEAPARLREVVSDYLKAVGPDGIPPVFMIGPTDLDWRSDQTERRRRVAAALLRSDSE